VVQPASERGVLFLTDSDNGLDLVDTVVAHFVPGKHPVLRFPMLHPELLLSEQSATRYMLLNLFHATAQANAEGKHLMAESVLRIRDQADARKLADARKMIESFHAQDAQEGKKGGQP